MKVRSIMTTKYPAYFVSHGGGPWPYVDGMKQMYEKTAREFSALPRRLPGKPKEVLVISGHWEAQDPSVSTAVLPPKIGRASRREGEVQNGWIDEAAGTLKKIVN